MQVSASVTLQPDISELILCADPRYVCETYVFEPNEREVSLGRLVAVAETEARDGVGNDLLDMVISAIQREYYRDPSRGILPSFESALHQANLVLHDSVDRGVRDWMGYFNVAIGVLAGNVLHISVAGEAMVLLARRARVATISYGLSHLPITNPLRTFSQVASGAISSRDTIYFGTGAFESLYQETDLSRLSLDHSASTISLRLQQHYRDHGATAPVSVVTVTILPQNIAEPRREIFTESPRRRALMPALGSPLPRKPLIIYRSRLRQLLATAGQLLVSIFRYLKTHVWPLVKKGSRRSGNLLVSTSRATGRGVQSLAQRQWQRYRQPKNLTIPRSPTERLRQGISSLPISSKIFAILAVVLAIAFVTSLLLLKHKRAEDQQIQRASELLHEARTKQESATTALIYNNRDQARSFLNDATQLADQLATTGLYTTETQELKTNIQTERDRLQKTLRLAGPTVTTVGDFSSLLSARQTQQLFFVDKALYTVNAENNMVVKMELDGKTSIVNQTSQGIGAFTTGVALEADKMLILATNEPGVAIFDTKAALLQKQEISLPAADAHLVALAPFGNRLYLYDQTTHNIFGYSKTLRGYSGGTAWLKKPLSGDDVASLAVDGFIYLLHADGSVTKFLKGDPVDFKTETIDPPIKAATHLVTNENLKNLYILDPDTKRVIVFNKKGELQQQIYFESAEHLTAIALSADEKTLYTLDGTRVVSAPLGK